MLWMVVAVIVGFRCLWLVWDRRRRLAPIQPKQQSPLILSPTFYLSWCTKHSTVSLIFSIKLLNSFTTRDILLQRQTPRTSLYKRLSPHILILYVHCTWFLFLHFPKTHLMNCYEQKDPWNPYIPYLIG